MFRLFGIPDSVSSELPKCLWQDGEARSKRAVSPRIIFSKAPRPTEL